MSDLLQLLADADRWLFLLINRTGQNPLFDLVMPALSDKRNAVFPGILIAAALLVRGGRRVWAWLAVAGLAVGLADGAGNLLKHAVERIRPCHVVTGVHLLAGCTQSFALPSNHAANMAAVAVVAWLGLPRWGWLMALLAVLVGYSRIYLGVHYPGDVLAGVVLGASLGCLLVLSVRALFPTTFARPVSATKIPRHDQRKKINLLISLK